MRFLAILLALVLFEHRFPLRFRQTIIHLVPRLSEIFLDLFDFPHDICRCKETEKIRRKFLYFYERQEPAQ